MLYSDRIIFLDTLFKTLISISELSGTEINFDIEGSSGLPISEFVE